MTETRLNQQLKKLKAEQKAKSRKKNSFESYIKVKTNKFEDKLTAVKITQKTDIDLFSNAIRELMKKK